MVALAPESPYAGLVEYPALDRSLYPYEHLVPRDPVENAKFRKRLNAAARLTGKTPEEQKEAKRFRASVVAMCRRDVLFFINVFGWTFEPRRTISNPITVHPFVTWPAQDGWIHEIVSTIEPEGGQILVKKPRDMGASWICLAIMIWEWCFSEEPVSHLVVSRKFELADGNSDSLLYKVRFFLKKLPRWLCPEYTDKVGEIKQTKTESLINAEATTGDVTVGGRRTRVLFDEFGKCAEAWEIRGGSTDVSLCRMFVSSPYAESMCFEDMWKSGIGKRIEPKWWDRPGNAVGLYRGADGQLRSPWYDEQERTRDSNDFRVNVLGEFLGGGQNYYAPETLARADGSAQAPWRRGLLTFDHLTLDPTGWQEDRDGFCLWWGPTGQNGKPSRYSRFAVGVDIATGTGASNSVIAVVERRTGEKVFEWADSRRSPRDWAKCAVAVAKWFNQAEIIWEANGPGRDFEKGVLLSGYENIWWRTTVKKARETKTDFPGWWNDPDTKEILFGAHREAVKSGRYVERSKATAEEMRFYVFGKTGHIENVRAFQAKDSSGARENHGDRVVATAVACKLLDEVGEVVEVEPAYEPGTVGYRWKMMDEDREKKMRFGERAWRV